MRSEPANRIVAAAVQRDPRFRPEHLRRVEDRGKPAGALLLMDRVVRVGSAHVRCAIITLLVEENGLEQDSALAVAIRDALEWARQQGYLLAMLWGHHWSAPRF